MSRAGDELSPAANDSGHPLPEDQFLAQEAASAKAAMVQTVHDLKAHLRAAVDVRAYTRRHPWIAVGAAAATGFAVGAVVKPSANNARRAVVQPAERQAEAPQRAAEGTLRPWLGKLLSDSLRTFAGVLAASAVQAVTQPPSPSAPVAVDPGPAAHEFDVSGTQHAESVGNLEGETAADGIPPTADWARKPR